MSSNADLIARLVVHARRLRVLGGFAEAHLPEEAADALAAADKRVGELQEAHERVRDEGLAMYRAYYDLKAERDALARDAERLDWAESNPEKSYHAISTWWHTAGQGYREARFNYRNVFDAAMREGEKKQ